LPPPTQESPSTAMQKLSTTATTSLVRISVSLFSFFAFNFSF
jgi:hypothetical protein